eukprot:jgi/Galph1/66/GphlegSOOS_G4790.1
MSDNASPAEIILACFCVSIAAMIITGVGCSINNHIRRRRGLRGFLDPTHNNRRNSARLSRRRTRRREKGLTACEVEMYCPEVVYKGELEIPILFLEDDTTSESGEEEEKVFSEPEKVFVRKFSEKLVKDEDTDTLKELSQNNNVSKGTPHRKTESERSYFLGCHILPDGVCAVCLETVEVDNHLRLLPCGHAFHVQCITHWLTCGNRCPLCNEAVRLSDNRTISDPETNISTNDATPVSLPAFMTVGLPGGDVPLGIEDRNNNEEYSMANISREAVMQSFERIRLRLYNRYLERQTNNSTVTSQPLDTIVVVGNETNA